MKNSIKVLLLTAIILSTGMESYSQVRRARRARVVRRAVNMRLSSRLILRRTAVVVVAAQRTVRENKVYTGNLARAIAHQRFARRLFMRGLYLRAVHHSRRARLLAFQAMRANKTQVRTDWEFNEEENQAISDLPGDDKLDKDLAAEYPNTSTNDEDFLDVMLDDIDVSESE